MKKLILIGAALFSVMAMQAQDVPATDTTGTDRDKFGFPKSKTTPTDTTRIHLGDLKIMIIDEDKQGKDSVNVSFEEEDENKTREALTHWGGIDLGMNLLMDADGNIDFSDESEWLNLDYRRSFSWDLNLYEQKIRIVKDYVGIITGLGVGIRSYGFRDSVEIYSSKDTTFGAYNPDITYRTNKLRTTHLKVPLLLEFNTSNDNSKSFHIAAGVVGGWRVGAVTKQKYEIDDKEVKTKVRGDYNLSPFTLDASVRVGFKNFTVFANYGLTPFFKEGKGPELYALNVGLALSSW